MLAVPGCDDEAASPPPVAEPATLPPVTPSGEPPAPDTPAPEPREADAPAAPEARTFTRSGERPGMQAIVTALEGDLPHASLLGRPSEVGDGRFVTVASTDSESPTLHFVVVSEHEGAQIEAVVRLPIEGIDATYNEAPSVVAREIADHDADGETEVMMVVSWGGPPEPAIGAYGHKHYFIFDLDPTPSIAISVETLLGATFDEIRGHVRLRDTNGDGHPDVTIRFTDCSGPDDCDRREAVFAWDEATDSWPTTP